MNITSKSLLAIAKVAAAIVSILFLYEFRVHIGFLLLTLSVLALTFALIVACFGTFQPKILVKYAEQFASSYRYLQQLVSSLFFPPVAPGSEITTATTSAAVDVEIQSEADSSSVASSGEAEVVNVSSEDSYGLEGSSHSQAQDSSDPLDS